MTQTLTKSNAYCIRLRPHFFKKKNFGVLSYTHNKIHHISKLWPSCGLKLSTTFLTLSHIFHLLPKAKNVVGLM